MLPLTILSCAAVLLLPASAAPLPFETSNLQQPTAILAAPPQQGLAADNFATSGAPATRGRAFRVPRGVGFREADYAVSAATAVQTVIPAQSTKATPAVLAAAAPTRNVFPRQIDVCTIVGCSGSPASATGTDPSMLSESQPAVDPRLDPNGLSASNNALAASLVEPPHATADGPGPEARPYAIKAKADPELSQSQDQLGDDSPTDTGATPLPIGGSATLAQVNAPLLMVSGTGDPTLPKVASGGPDSSSASSSTAHKIGTVATEPHPQHERRGRFRLTRYLSGSSLYPDSDPNPQPINPREVETVELDVPTAGMRKTTPLSNEQAMNMGTDQPFVVNVSYPPTQDA